MQIIMSTPAIAQCRFHFTNAAIKTGIQKIQVPPIHLNPSMNANLMRSNIVDLRVVKGRGREGATW